MHFDPHHIYHVYNRGNDGDRLFFKPDNYLYFLTKVRNEWLDYCDVLSYCLMPNHFHFMLEAKPKGCTAILTRTHMSQLQPLSRAIGKTMSSYTQAINKQNKTSGTLFQKKTKAKCLTDYVVGDVSYPIIDYLTNCFHYIHDNPIKSNLVTDLSNWQYSSWPDYFNNRKGTLCNKEKLLSIAQRSGIDLLNRPAFEFNQVILDSIW